MQGMSWCEEIVVLLSWCLAIFTVAQKGWQAAVGYCVAPQLPKSVLGKMDGWPSRQESVEMSRFGFKEPILKEALDKLFKEA